MASNTDHLAEINGHFFWTYLGGGSYGHVWKSTDKLDNSEYAVKQVKIFKTMNKIFTDEDCETSKKALKTKIKREMDNHYQLNSSFVVKYHSHWYYEGEDGERGEDQLLSEIAENVTEQNFPSSSCSESGKSGSEPGFSRIEDPGHECLFIKMEFCNNQSLKDFLKANPTLENRVSETPRIIHHTAKGLEAIHSLGIIHRDLSPANIFCHKMPGEANLIWKIGDLGLSIQRRMLQVQEEEARSETGSTSEGFFSEDGSSSQPSGSDSQSDYETFAGAPWYRSPEMKGGDPYTEKTDIFTLALIYLEVLNIFDEKKKEKPAFFANLREGMAPLLLQNHVPATFSHYTDVLLDMLLIEEAERPSATQVFQRTLPPIHFGFPIMNREEMGYIKKMEKSAEIKRKLLEEEKNLIIYGKGGMGKRTLVWKLLNEDGSFKTMNIIWIEVFSPENTVTALAAEVGVRAREDGFLEGWDDSLEVMGKVFTAFSTIYSKYKMLFVLYKIPNEERPLQIVELLEKEGLPFLILTEGKIEIPPGNCTTEEIEINGFSDAEALEYISSASITLTTPLSQSEVEEIHNFCGNNPLYLSHAMKLCQVMSTKETEEFLEICGMKAPETDLLDLIIQEQYHKLPFLEKEILHVFAFYHSMTKPWATFTKEDLLYLATNCKENDTVEIEIAFNFDKALHNLVEQNLLSVSKDGTSSITVKTYHIAFAVKAALSNEEEKIVERRLVPRLGRLYRKI